MTREGRIVWGQETHQLVPRDTLHQLPGGAVWETTKGWLPTFSLQDLPLPAPPCPYLPLLAMGQAYWGAESLPSMRTRQNPSLENVCPESTLPCVLHQGSAFGKREVGREVRQAGSLPTDSSYRCAEVPLGGQRRELLPLTGPDRDGSPEGGRSWAC